MWCVCGGGGGGNVAFPSPIWSIVVQVFIFGPSFSVISKSTPIAGKGVSISENNMHPSVPYALQGCRLNYSKGVTVKSLQ